MTGAGAISDALVIPRLKPRISTAWPGHAPAEAVNDTTALSATDLLPTFCSLVGAEPPDGHDGEDMLDVFAAAERMRSTPLMWEWHFDIAGHVLHKSPMLSNLDGKWKLLANPDCSRIFFVGSALFHRQQRSFNRSRPGKP